MDLEQRFVGTQFFQKKMLLKLTELCELILVIMKMLLKLTELCELIN